jgi:antibiotic biosynthesis monooxygenase (ABM) superfamily enzyme
MNAGPVTVSIVRHVEPEHAAQMIAWVRSGSSLAERFDGFLGTGWVRPADDSDEWHMLYRFADHASLDVWESSPQRAWWLGSAQGLVGESRVERRTGIEGWFDEPATTQVEEAGTARAAPPRWKQAMVIWLAFFPLSLVTTLVLGWWVPDLHVALRVLLSTVLMTPVMTYLALPFMTTRLAWWLHR